MTAFHDTAKSGTDNSSGTSTPTADTVAETAGDVVIAFHKWEGANGAVDSISDGTGDTWTAVSAVQNHTNNDLHLHLWWKVASGSGSRTVTATLDVARPYRRLGVITITPTGGTTWQIGNVPQGTNGNSNASPTAGSAAGVAAGVALMASGTYGDRDFTAGTGFTVPAEFATANMAVVEYDLTPSGTIAFDGAFSAGVEWLAHGAVFEEVTASGPFELEQVGSIGLQGTLGISGDIAVEAVVPVVAVAPIALTGTLAIAGDITFEIKNWRIPTSAPASTSVHVTILNGSGNTYSIVTQGRTTVHADGHIYFPAQGTLGQKSFAFVHNYDDDTETTSIYGGPCIATIVDVG